MSNHRQSTANGPSVARIAGWAALTLTTTTTSTWILIGEGLTYRDMAGGAFGFMLGAVLMVKTVDMAVSKLLVRERRRREAQARRHLRAVNTGTWIGESWGQELTIRWEPETASYFAEGWVSEHWSIHPETHWKDRDELVLTLLELERTGEMVPVDDTSTNRIRARLGLPEWVDEDPGKAPAWPEPIPQTNPTWDDYHESALRPSGVPAFKAGGPVR
jgi:hypothetical protein